MERRNYAAAVLGRAYGIPNDMVAEHLGITIRQARRLIERANAQGHIAYVRRREDEFYSKHPFFNGLSGEDGMLSFGDYAMLSDISSVLGTSVPELYDIEGEILRLKERFLHTRLAA